MKKNQTQAGAVLISLSAIAVIAMVLIKKNKLVENVTVSTAGFDGDSDEFLKTFILPNEVINDGRLCNYSSGSLVCFGGDWREPLLERARKKRGYIR